MADPVPAVHEGPGKGKAFFDRAHTVAESSNYDYAIDMYIQGLDREPQNITEHQNLSEVALRRKIKGGKPATGMFGAKVPFKAKSPKEHMLNAEFLLAKDPGNVSLMLTFIRQAAAAEYEDVIRWFGPILIIGNKNKPKREIYLELADIYEGIKEYKKASESLQHAIELTPMDMDLLARSKDLAAKETIVKGKYETATDFKESIRDIAGTKTLSQEENLVKSEDYRKQVIEKTRLDYEANPHELQVIAKYVKALTDMETEDFENLAIEILLKAYAETKIYRFKVTIGDIKMKQFKRNLRVLRDTLKLDPSDKALIQQYLELDKERLAFELEEYTERSKHFPTDMLILFEYGYRLYQAKRFDEAIRVFQIAQNNPKHRADALHLLGRSFMEQGMHHEAMDTLRKAIDEYELAETGDQKSKEFHYWLARAYEETGRAEDAVNLFSTITQWDITFRDTRTRLETLRKALKKT